MKRKVLMLAASLLECIPSSLLVVFGICFGLKRRDIELSDVVIIVPAVGFGHTITIPSIAQYLWRKPLIIFATDERRHNTLISKVWDSAKVLFIRNTLLFSLPVNARVFAHVTTGYLKIINTRTPLLFATDGNPRLKREFSRYKFLYDELVRKESDRYQFAKSELPTHYWVSIWLDLLVRGRIKSQIDMVTKNFHNFWKLKARIGKNRKCVTIYLRRKGGKGEDSFLRNGNSPKDYRVVINDLLSENYAVLLVGDYCCKDFKIDSDYFIDETKIKTSKNEFYILATALADLFVGDPGGGLHLPAIFMKPIIIQNAFPFTAAMPNSLLILKELLDDHGHLISVETRLEDFQWCYQFPSDYRLEPVNPAVTSQAIRKVLTGSLEDFERFEKIVSKTQIDYTRSKIYAG